jgi:hypothetical protein
MSNAEREGSRPSNRDAALERAWRKASAEQPPTDLDAAIIAAARKSVPDRGDSSDTVGARGRSRNWLTQWQPLAAAAAVAGLAFVLVQTLPREHGLAPAMQRKESAPAPAELQSHRASARDATDDNRQAPSADRGEAQRGRVAVPDRAPAPGAVPAPPPAPTPSASTGEAPASDTAQSAGTAATVGEAATDRRKAAEPEMAGRAAAGAAAAPSSPARERALGNTATLDAAARAAKIVTLYESGDLPAAEDALRVFRAADPDADTYLPHSLRTWARTVQ